MARAKLAQIEKKFFKGVDLASASLLEGNERRAFRLSQVERLMADVRWNNPKGMLLSDVFWPPKYFRNQPYENNPLMSADQLQTLTDNERDRLQLIMEVAGLCQDLGLHHVFNLKEAFGIRNDFRVTNRQLVELLFSTEYEHIAMHLACTMRRLAIFAYRKIYYGPAQDMMAELISKDSDQLVRAPENSDMTPQDYVKTIYDAILQIERHWRRGRRLKLDPEVVVLHDEICGVVPNRFDKWVLQAAAELFDYMDTELQGRLLLKGYNPDNMWSDQPESVKRETGKILERFVDKVHDVRSKYLAEGWLTDDSLAFSYLMSHAERCGYGWWRKTGTAL